MSSSIWTRAELLSSVRALSGRCWRFVEAQHHVSTTKITDTRQEQEQLEALLEADKPPVPEECRALHYLLFTPFRYGAAYPTGSRFRRAGLTPGVFYASENAHTAAIETAFYRLLFFAESPDTPWPTNPGEYTAFMIEYATARAVDLTAPPLNQHSAIWMHPTSYDGCQQLADAARNEDVDIIKYQSVRNPAPSANLAILHCRAFVNKEPMELQTWRIQLSATGVRLICEYPKMAFDLDRSVLALDARIGAINWNR